MTGGLRQNNSPHASDLDGCSSPDDKSIKHALRLSSNFKNGFIFYWSIADILCRGLPFKKERHPEHSRVDLLGSPLNEVCCEYAKCGPALGLGASTVAFSIPG